MKVSGNVEAFDGNLWLWPVQFFCYLAQTKNQSTVYNLNLLKHKFHLKNLAWRTISEDMNCFDFVIMMDFAGGCY